MPEAVRVRFPPSPTGHLHVGGARTALFNWLFARHHHGTYVLRIEDTDLSRSTDEYTQSLLEALRWLGLDWDEGPDVGGPAAPYRQSERLGAYAATLARLREAGLVYPCFCSRAEVAAAARAPHGPPDEGPRYPGTCAGLSTVEAKRRSLGRRPSWRFRAAPAPVRFEDGVHGPRVVDVAAEVGDFVVARADGVPAYQLAVVVDDVAMAVTDVVRGDDLLSSTGRQLLLYAALDAAPPRFAHVPLVVGEDGERLAKRHGALSLGELRARGTDPRAVVGLLAELTGLAPPGARLAPVELVAGFSLARLPRAPAVLDPAAVLSLACGGAS
jgi:glutamyl-tRNA synthetase